MAQRRDTKRRAIIGRQLQKRKELIRSLFRGSADRSLAERYNGSKELEDEGEAEKRGSSTEKTVFEKVDTDIRPVISSIQPRQMRFKKRPGRESVVRQPKQSKRSRRSRRSTRERRSRDQPENQDESAERGTNEPILEEFNQAEVVARPEFFLALKVMIEIKKRRLLENILDENETEEVRQFFETEMSYPSYRIMRLIHQALNKCWEVLIENYDKFQFTNEIRTLMCEREKLKCCLFDVMLSFPEYIPESWGGRHIVEISDQGLVSSQGASNKESIPNMAGKWHDERDYFKKSVRAEENIRKERVQPVAHEKIGKRKSQRERTRKSDRAERAIPLEMKSESNLRPRVKAAARSRRQTKQPVKPAAPAIDAFSREILMRALPQYVDSAPRKTSEREKQTVQARPPEIIHAALQAGPLLKTPEIPSAIKARPYSKSPERTPACLSPKEIVVPANVLRGSDECLIPKRREEKVQPEPSKAPLLLKEKIDSDVSQKSSYFPLPKPIPDNEPFKTMQDKNLGAPLLKKTEYTAETSSLASKKAVDLCKTAEDKEFTEFEALKMERRTEAAHRLTSEQAKNIDRTAEDRDLEAELLTEKARTPGTSQPPASEKVKDYLKTAEDKDLETKEKTELHVRYSSPPQIEGHERSLDKTADDDRVNVSLSKKNGHVQDISSPLITEKLEGPMMKGKEDLEETSQKKNVPVLSKQVPYTFFENLLRTADDQEYDDYSKRVKAEVARLPDPAFKEVREQISVKTTEDGTTQMTDINKKERTHSLTLAEERTQENGHDSQREDSSKSEKRGVAVKKTLQDQSESDKHLKESKTKGQAPVSDIPLVDVKQKSEDVQLKVNRNAEESAVKHKLEHEEADQNEKYAEGEEKEDEG